MPPLCFAATAFASYSPPLDSFPHTLLCIHISKEKRQFDEFYIIFFKGEKNQITRDLAAQTQKLVEAKMTIQRLSDQNRDLQSDLNLSINLLRNKPNSFVSPKIDSLPPEVRSRVKTYIEGGSSSSGNGQTR